MKKNTTVRSRSKATSVNRQARYTGVTDGKTLKRVVRSHPASRSSSYRSSPSKSVSVRSRSVSRSSPFRQRSVSRDYRVVYRAASARPRSFTPMIGRARSASVSSFVRQLGTLSPRSPSVSRSSSSSPYVTFSRTPARVVIPPTPSPSPARSRSSSSTPRTLVFNL